MLNTSRRTNRLSHFCLLQNRRLSPSIRRGQKDKQEAAIEGVVEGSKRLASRFQAMIGWEQLDHPVVIFKAEKAGGHDEISGIDILSLNRNERWESQGGRARRHLASAF